ncbi:ABC 3 transport family protein [Gleimia coleocanis DSM 15436]|uniref:ABC 3 transport family protein n=1 Tax=Gleimia coleocanis DSM 15436 TaxID=525245 RepID=C0VY74_9ACTO|nr:iron chelate uptake ABC transporter family permease subunit [Gleimia coleocanis]EEH64377.1 ABC 3 transport family protein [Gleimia coleocanis DSM 15436]
MNLAVLTLLGDLVATSEGIGIVEFLTNYTFRTMLIGTTLIGLTSGALGCFLYLRKQSLISDVIGHSAIAGVMFAFIVATTVLGIEGRSMLVLTIGAVISATIAVLVANWVTADSRVSIDAAMAICLSLFYGVGMVLMRQITHSSLQGRGGIDKYMFGNAATLLESDLYTIGLFGGGALLVMVLLWKEFKVFTFDPVLATQLGFSPRILTPLLMGAATIAIVIGVKAVGLILMIAFAIMPAAAARQWTKRLSSMVALAALIGGVSGALGSFLSVNMGKVPTGPIVVIILFVIFLLSITFAPERSMLRRSVMRRAKARELAAIARGEITYEEARALNNQPDFARTGQEVEGN